MSIDRNYLRRFATETRNAHDPANQADNGYERCALCHYTRHPCDCYELADAICQLLDEW